MLFNAVKGSRRLIEHLKETPGYKNLKDKRMPKSLDDRQLLQFVVFDNYGFNKHEMAKAIGTNTTNVNGIVQFMKINHNKFNRLIKNDQINIDNNLFKETYNPIIGPNLFVRSEKLLRKKQYSVDKKAAQFNPNNPKTWEGLVETHGDTVKGDTLKFVIPSLKFPVARKFVTDDIKVRTGESATVGGPGNIVDKNKSWPGFVEKFKPEQSSNLLKSPRIAVNNLKKQFPSLDRLQGELDLVRSGTLKEKTPYEKLRRRIEQTFKANNPLAQKYLNFLAKRRKDVRNHLGIAKDADEAIEFEHTKAIVDILRSKGITGDYDKIPEDVMRQIANEAMDLNNMNLATRRLNKLKGELFEASPASALSLPTANSLRLRYNRYLALERQGKKDSDEAVKLLKGMTDDVEEFEALAIKEANNGIAMPYNFLNDATLPPVARIKNPYKTFDRLDQALEDYIRKLNMEPMFKSNRTYKTSTLPDTPAGYRQPVLRAADGGSAGLEAAASPAKAYFEDVQQMMDTAGLDMGDAVIELMKDDAKRKKFNLGGMVGNDYGGFAYDEESTRNKVGALESLLAGIGSGLIDIPKGAFTLGAALMDVGFGTNNSAKMEAWFDDLTTWDEKAESHWLGSFAKIATNLGVPGAYGYKAGAKLAEKALLAKRNGTYFKLTDPTLQEKFNTSLNAKGRLLATLGGAAGVGATDAIFVGDPEGVGTFGDMIGAGPTELDPNDANLASKEIANRVRFGVDGALFLGLIGGTGSAVKSLARRRNELESNNDAIDKFFSVFRPRGKKSQAFFDMERQNIGARAGDINFAGEQARKLDKHIDAIFPFVKNPFNKLGNKGRSEFMDKLNDTLLSGEIRMDPSGKVNFGPMDEKLINEVRRIMKSKNAKKEDIDGVFDSFEQMRLGWGHIFSRLGYSMDDVARTEFKELFGNKFKSYLGSTYEIFQNKSLLPFLRYKPTEEAVEKTIKLFMDSASEAGKPISRGEAELFVNRAIETVKMPRDISTSKEKTTGIYFDAPEFFANKTVLDEIELGKKTVAFDDLAEDSKKIMAELFGKVSDPMQTMLTGTNRLSLIGRRNQFFNDLVQADDVLIPKREEFLKANPGASLPKELKGFFRETEAEAVEAFGGNIKKIEIDPSRTIEAGITNPVNGKYAERGVAEALEEASQVAADKSTLQQMYESFILYPKATSQLAKTVLSPITHVRNFVSAGAFATANGLIPGLVSPEDFGRAFKEAFGQLQIPGARMDNERYRELLRLGVVNSNVRLGDLQRLLKDTNFGESVNSRKALRELMRPFSKFKKFTEDAYTAEDDFWKLTSFALERQRLGRAYEKYGIAKTAKELDEEAADIIRNNIPNYDMVNDFIKATRKLPLGNFVSFPAEIMRTTANILNRSLKEINFEHTLSDGRIVKPLQGIGYKRLFGMGTTVVGVPYATSEAFKAIYDVTEDEMQALRRFVPDWSRNSTILPIRGDDGKLKYIDFSHANAYDTMIRPINSMIIGVQRGVEEGELAKEVLKSMYEGTKETLSPFFSESIWTNALSDIVIRNGRTREGRRLYTDQTPWGERVNKSLLHLAETQFPGSIASFQRLDLAFEPVDILKKGKFDEYGNTFNIPDEALGFIGMRAVEVDPVKAMKFKIADFRTGINNARREFTSPLLRGGPITPQQIAERYQIASEALYNVQEKMFRDYFAAMELGSSVGQLDREFADRVSKVQLNAIKRGEFKPFIPSENIEEAFAENARAIGQPNPYIQARQFIRNLIRLYDGVPFGVGLPNVRNPFRVDRSLPIQNSPAFQGLGQGLTSSLPTAPTGGALPNQTRTAMAGQRVFGATDPIFGVG